MQENNDDKDVNKFNKYNIKYDIDSAIDFLNNINKKNIVIVSHDDSDGSCSAALIIRLLRQIARNSKVSYFSTRCSPRISDELMADIISEKPDIVITCDFAGDLDKSANYLDTQGIKTLMIDHHIVSDFKFPKSCIYINPQLEGKTMPCAAYIYDICNKIVDFKKHIWIAGIGTIEDFGASDREDIIKACIKEYLELFEKKEINNSKLFDTSFGLVGKILSSTATWASYKGSELVTKVLLDINSPREFLSLDNKDVRNMFDKFQIIEKDIRNAVRAFDENNEVSGRLRSFYIKSELPLKSKVSTIVSAKKEYYTDAIIIIEESEKSYSMSLRNQSGDFDLNQIINESLVGLNGSGGGHKKACGAVVSKKDFDVFIKRLKEKIV